MYSSLVVASGIGADIAEALARKDYCDGCCPCCCTGRLVFHYFQGGRAKAVALDLSSILSIESTVAFLGHPVDVLINNAGIQLEDFPADRFQ